MILGLQYDDIAVQSVQYQTALLVTCGLTFE